MKEELSPAIEAYMRFRSSQDYSKGTLRSDAQVLKKFLAVNGNLWCHAITERHVERHFEDASKTRKAASLKNDHGVLVRFFKWARHTGRMPADSNPMFGRRQPKVTKKERNRIAVEHFPLLLDTAGEHEPRNRALVALLLYTLLRDNEVTDLRIRDLDLNGGYLTVRVYKSHLEDRMPISEELDREMRLWLTEYTKAVGNLEPHYYLVPSRAVSPVRDEGGRITHHDSHYRPERPIRASGRVVSPILERMGFPIHDDRGKPCGEGAHTIRRSGARALFDELVKTGYDHGLRVVQSLLHHASVTQTETYIGVTADRRSRDELIKGRAMYSAPAEVIQLRRES